MFGIASVVTILLFLGSAAMGLFGCAEVNPTASSQDVKAFFVAGNEATYRGLQLPSSGYVDLSAYSHLMGIKYPRTFHVDVLKQPPSRPYKSFAVLECEPVPNAKPEATMEDLKNKAKEIGADAIILGYSGSDRGLVAIPPNLKVQAVAIRYILPGRSDKEETS
jgi:hypothetical protein